MMVLLGDHAEYMLRPSEERAHGAGLVLAEAVIGVGNGLHSKAPLVLPLLLQEDVLDPSKVKPATQVCALHPGIVRLMMAREERRNVILAMRTRTDL